MKNILHIIAICVIALFAASCDKKNDGLILPNLDDDFPQIILFADDGDGELEDEDNFSFAITLAERPDPEGRELSGKIVPLVADVTVYFEVGELQGFSRLDEYIVDAIAYYEIDDCTTSDDLNIDLNLVFDTATGKGSVTFPGGVEEIEIEFETNPDRFDDDILNEEPRMFEIVLTGVDAGSQLVAVNTQNTFEYTVLDDEAIYGEYQLDLGDAKQVNAYLTLFGLINEALVDLSVDEIEEIVVEFKYGEFATIIVLNETEAIDECGETEIEHVEIEIEADLEEIDDNSAEGDVEMVGHVEMESGAEEEFTFQGSFKLKEGLLLLKLQGEFDGKETDEMTLKLNK